MELNNQESLLLTHHRNLLTLSQAQLEAVNQGDFVKFDALIIQKQMIIEQVNGLLAGGFSLEQCRLETRLQIRKTILDAMGLEEELQIRVSKIKGAVQQEMTLLGRENKLNEKYGIHTETSRFFDESR